MYEGQFSLGMCLGVFIQGILPYPKVRLVPSKPFFRHMNCPVILYFDILYSTQGKGENDN